MHTDIAFKRCETRSRAIAASPDRVHRFVADAFNIPRWAPAFATAVRPSGDHWVATTAGGDAEIVVASHPNAGTVDIVSADDTTRGAFIRVIPNGPVSEIVFTLLFEPGTSEEAIAAQMTVVDDELAAVDQLV